MLFCLMGKVLGEHFGFYKSLEKLWQIVSHTDKVIYIICCLTENTPRENNLDTLKVEAVNYICDKLW